MTLRPLGSSGIDVAPLAFGGNVFGWTVDESTGFALLDAFIDDGFNLVDTANMYSTWVPGHQGGESESMIGRWLATSGKRDRVVLATKVGIEMGDGSKGLSRENIIRSVEDSLARLKTDRIDLYQSHIDDLDTPLEETLSAYATLIEQGKVRAIGASNYEAARLREALDLSASAGLPAYVSLQPEYNLFDRAGYEEALEPLCEERGIGVIGYYSLASGFLTGKYRSESDLGQSVRGGGIAKYLMPRGFRILSALDEIAAAHGVKPATIALAWLIQRPSVTAPIVSATTVSQWQEIARSASLALSASEIEALNLASAAGE